MECHHEDTCLHQRLRGPRLRDASAQLTVALAEAAHPARSQSSFTGSMRGTSSWMTASATRYANAAMKKIAM